MEDVHPSPTAGDGRRIRQGTSKPGDPNDDRISCSQCGFPFNPDRDTEGDAGGDDDHSGVTIETTIETFANTVDSLPVQLRDVASFLETSRDVDDPVVTAGCPMCGTFNPRGNFRNDRSFDSGIDVSNQ